jgi:endonuclease/exonuclease/phosphatase (EEP) superfamily protein YafD
LLEIEDFAPQCDGSQSNIVVGDFNEDGDGEAVEFLQREGFDDVLPQFHPGQPTWRYRSVAGQLEDTVDHILYDDSLRALDSWVEVKGRSDHLPVLAHFEPLVWVSPTAAE